MDFNRRSFIATLAASLSTAAAAQAAGSDAVSEHPDLLAMSDKLPSILQSYRDAAAKVDSIERTWGPQWPTPDPDIISYSNGSKTHADILGRGIKTPWGLNGIERVQNIGTPECFENDCARHMKEAARKSKFKSQRGMKTELRMAELSKARIEPARVYWSEVERIEAESGVSKAIKAKSKACTALNGLVGEILLFEERTPLGLGAKAQALSAFTELPFSHQCLNLEAPKWLAALSATMLRQSTNQPGTA